MQSPETVENKVMENRHIQFDFDVPELAELAKDSLRSFFAKELESIEQELEATKAWPYEVMLGHAIIRRDQEIAGLERIKSTIERIEEFVNLYIEINK